MRPDVYHWDALPGVYPDSFDRGSSLLNFSSTTTNETDVRGCLFHPNAPFTYQRWYLWPHDAKSHGDTNLFDLIGNRSEVTGAA
jgi:hypothetical protein